MKPLTGLPNGQATYSLVLGWGITFVGQISGKAEAQEPQVRLPVGQSPVPLKGRGAGYSERHLERLERIRTLQSEGLTLAEMGSGLDGQVRTAKLDPAPWWQYQVAGDVTVWVQAGVAPWRARQIRKAIEQMAAALGMPEKEGKGDDE